MHRRDIDGLRAVAVLPIVAFHAGASVLSGGFVGVDIFFVISGYLITRNILRDIEQGRFSLGEFYKRRAARIFPALFAMLLIVTLAGAAFLLPQELDELAHSAVAATFFLANVFFWRGADYFSHAAETKPLLHTWSLGVEEQFYIFYPLGLLLIARYAPKYLKHALVAGICASLAAGAYLSFRLPTAAFYLLPTRAWELGLGAALAAGLFPAVKNRAAFAWGGLAMIATGVLFAHSDSGFPVPWAIPPVVGAALVIAYAPDTGVARLLSLRPMVWVGLISYSLYLWHWPIFAFYRLGHGIRLTGIEGAALFVAALAAASLSYVAVERPMLRMGRTMAVRPVLKRGAFGMLVTAVILGMIGNESSRIVQPTARVAALASFSDYTSTEAYRYQFRPGPCFRTSRAPGAFDPRACLARKPGRKTILLVGDSHAAQYWRALQEKHPAMNVLQATRSSCLPADSDSPCQALYAYALGPGLKGVDKVVFAGRWTEQQIPALLRAARRVRDAGVPLVIVGPVAQYDGDLPLILARGRMRGDPDAADGLRLKSVEALDRKMRRAVTRAGFAYVSVQDVERANGWPTLTPSGKPMSFDYGHFTLDGARWIVARLPI